MTEECVVLVLYLNNLIRPTPHSADRATPDGKHGDLPAFDLVKAVF